jgi:hypothetical protein
MIGFIQYVSSEQQNVTRATSVMKRHDFGQKLHKRITCNIAGYTIVQKWQNISEIDGD